MSEWISVKDRLPSEFETVIVGRSDDHVCPCAREAMHRGNGKFMQSGLNIDFVNPTHWMPLPEPPSDRGES